MQLYFPNLKTIPGVIALFDFILASKESDNANIIFNSDLFVEDFDGFVGRTHYPVDENVLEFSDLPKFLSFVLENFNKSSSQIFQDLYVLYKLNNKDNGTFVDIGTAYPTGHNNSYFLESKKNWNGVLVEPNNKFFKDIENTRTSPLVKKAIYTTSNKNLQLNFSNFLPGGCLQEVRDTFVYNQPDINTDYTQPVETVTLVDLLDEYCVEKNFDYLSYDTTGSFLDVDVLNQMLESGYLPRVITIGHNYKNHRPDLLVLLTKYGYKKEFDFLSRWDDWYYLEHDATR